MVRDAVGHNLAACSVSCECGRCVPGQSDELSCCPKFLPAWHIDACGAGIGLYPTGAMVNHNCRPNAVQSFVGAAIVFRCAAWRMWHCLRTAAVSLSPVLQRHSGASPPAAMCPQLRASDMHPIGISGTIMSEMHSRLHMRRAVRAILPGEEVTISYTDLKATRPERRAFLLRHYHFDVDAGTAAAAAAEQQPADVHLSGQAPGIATSVSRQPPGPLDAVDQQLTALQTPGAVRNPLLCDPTHSNARRHVSAARSGPAAESLSANARCQQQ